MSRDEDLLQELDQAVHNPGRIVVGPTGDLASGSYPYGGAGYGLVDEVGFEPGPIEVEVVRQSVAATSKVVRVGERPILVFVLKGWNGSLLQSFLPTEAAAQGYASSFRYTGGANPGVVPAIEKVLFVSDDLQGRCVLFRRPVPRFHLARRIALSIRDPSLFVLAFTPTRSSTDTTLKRPWQVARIESLNP